MQEPKLTLSDSLNMGELYGPAMEITDAKEAAIYFEALVERQMRFGHTREVAEQIERSNLGYYSGYSSFETRQRVENLFGGVHPLLGSTAKGLLSSDEVFRIGYELGESLKRDNS
jgi:hypothetical protein